MMPWWFWFIPGFLLVICAGIPLWGWLLRRRNRDG